MQDYAKAIKELREKMMMSQMEFAKIIDVAYESINRWENGKFIPTFRYRRKFVELFKEYDIKLEEKE
jgi:DNA-binding XRE family transcriptional regulator